jgi:hypothetical protein
MLPKITEADLDSDTVKLDSPIAQILGRVRTALHREVYRLLYSIVSTALGGKTKTPDRALTFAVEKMKRSEFSWMLLELL